MRPLARPLSHIASVRHSSGRRAVGSLEGGLTDKQRAFVAEYLVDFNATQAAIRAGYSENSAAAIGYENLRKPDIARALTTALLARAERLEVTEDVIVAGLLKEAMSAGSDAARVSAWTQLGKYKAMFTDRMEHSGDLPAILVERSGDE